MEFSSCYYVLNISSDSHISEEHFSIQNAFKADKLDIHILTTKKSLQAMLFSHNLTSDLFQNHIQ